MGQQLLGLMDLDQKWLRIKENQKLVSDSPLYVTIFDLNPSTQVVAGPFNCPSFQNFSYSFPRLSEEDTTHLVSLPFNKSFE